MPVLTKINTNSIADDAVTAAKTAAAADAGGLGFGDGNLSGTISGQQAFFADAFTLTGDLTVNDDLVLGKVRDDGTGQSLTGDGKTLTGTGTLTMGSSVEGEPKAGRVTSVDGMTGDLGSGVDLNSATFPAGHVVQTVFNTYNAQNSDVTNSSTFARVSKDSVYHWKGEIDNVGDSNHVLIHMTFGFSLSKTATNVGAGFGVFRDTTAIFTPSSISWYWQTSSSTLIERYKQASITWMDTSPGTGTNEYYLGFRNSNSSALYVRSDSGHIPFVCTLMEIAR